MLLLHNVKNNFLQYCFFYYYFNFKIILTFLSVNQGFEFMKLIKINLTFKIQLLISVLFRPIYHL